MAVHEGVCVTKPYLRVSHSLRTLSYDPDMNWFESTGDHATADTHAVCDVNVHLTTAPSGGDTENEHHDNVADPIRDVVQMSVLCVP